MMISGIPITLYVKTKTGVDDFNRDVFSEAPVTVNNVVVGQPSSDDAVNEMNPTGKTISYVLAIPKDDTHEWENTTVEFYGKKWRTVGIAKQYMNGFMGVNFPWNKQIGVERFSDEPESTI